MRLSHTVSLVAAVGLMLPMCSIRAIEDGTAPQGALAEKLHDPAPYLMLAYARGDYVRFTFPRPALRSAFKNGTAIDLPGMDFNSFEAHFSIIRANYAFGKEIHTEELRRLLETQRVVIVSMNNRPVNAMFLQLLKEDAVVLQVDRVGLLVHAVTPRDFSRKTIPPVEK